MRFILNNDKCHFRYVSVPYVDKIIYREVVRTDPRKLKALTDMPPPKSKMKVQIFLGMINYLNKFFPATQFTVDHYKG